MPGLWAAIGGGLGLALTTDFRVATPETRFAANFVLLGFHQGFGLSLTLPRLLGQQQANLMLYTGRRYTGQEGLRIGLCDYLVEPEQLRQRAFELAREIAQAAPLAVQAVRATMRQGLADEFRRATAHEAAQQSRLRATADFKEGIQAVAERGDGPEHLLDRAGHRHREAPGEQAAQRERPELFGDLLASGAPSFAAAMAPWVRLRTVGP